MPKAVTFSLSQTGDEQDMKVWRRETATWKVSGYVSLACAAIFLLWIAMTVLRAETNKAFSVAWRTVEEMEREGDGVKNVGGERRAYHEIEGMTKLHAMKNHSSLVQLSTVYLCSLANCSHKVCACTHTHTNRTTDNVLCQNQPTVCLFCYQSSKATCGSQSVLCCMYELAGDAKNAMVSTAVIWMTLKIRKFDAGLKGIVHPEIKILISFTIMSFQIHKTLANLWNTKIVLM